MKLITRVTLLGIIAVTTVGRPSAAQITDEEVRSAIDRGVRYLKRQQRPNGSWDASPSFPGGATALCTLALLNCGVEVDDPAVHKALNHLRDMGTQANLYGSTADDGPLRG